MLERIADKSSYGAIDPVFIPTPSRSNTEPFDSALSRAAAPRSSDGSQPRAEDRDRSRPGSNNATHNDDRSESAASNSASGTSTSSSTGADAHSDDASQSSCAPADATAGDIVTQEEQSAVGDANEPEAEIAEQADDESDEKTAEEIAAEVAANLVQVVTPPEAVEEVDAEQSEAKAVVEDPFGGEEQSAPPLPTDPATNATADPTVGNKTDADTASNANTDGAPQPHAAEPDVLLASATTEKQVPATTRKQVRPSTEEQGSAAAATDTSTTQTLAGEQTTLRAVPTQSNATGSERQTRSGARSKTDRGDRAAPPASPSSALVQKTNANSSGEVPSTQPAPESSPSTPTLQAAAPNPEIAAANASTPRDNSQPTDAASARSQVGRLGNGRGNAAARANHGANPEAEVQRVRLVQRVARAFQTIGEAGGEVRLRLSPPSLGSIKLEVTLQNGVMAARIETETQAARTMLVENLPALRERLAMHDIKVAHFDVEVSADSRQQQQSPQQDDAPRDRNGHGLFRDGSRSTSDAASTVPAPRTQHARSALDVLI